MFRGWKGISISIAVALALFAGAVLYAIHAAPAPQGFSGLEFNIMTPAASARTPMLRRGALVSKVMADSSAARAGIVPGEVVAAIDGTLVRTARQASDLVRAGRAGERLTLTLYDITKGEVRPRDVTLTLDAEPPLGKNLSVKSPRTLARKSPPVPTVAANAAWSKRILRGPTIKPVPLSGLGDGPCNGFAPQGWKVAGHQPRTLHVMAIEGFAHAIHHTDAFSGDAQAYVRAYLEKQFGAPPLLTPPQDRPHGFVLQDFGNARGGAGFVVYRLRHGRIALWLAAVPGADVSWGKPLVGAVALSMRCKAPDTPKPRPQQKDMPATSVSLDCLNGQCGESDFAATYLTVLRKGYVHNLKGEMFLVNPRRDFWQSGAEGPGFYRQVGGENEKLLPGRIN
ncbi:MAG: hypothetical protein RJB58_2454 [Pseudomonadota bacterium]|jgi:hypothetical protein